MKTRAILSRPRRGLKLIELLKYPETVSYSPRKAPTNQSRGHAQYSYAFTDSGTARWPMLCKGMAVFALTKTAEDSVRAEKALTMV